MIPAHIAVNLKDSDFEWTPLEPLPAAPTPTPAEPPSPVAAETLTADEFVKRLDDYYGKLSADELIARADVAHEARKQPRREAKRRKAA
jgi:hypothetical protein